MKIDKLRKEQIMLRLEQNRYVNDPLFQACEHLTWNVARSHRLDFSDRMVLTVLIYDYLLEIIGLCYYY